MKNKSDIFNELFPNLSEFDIKVIIIKHRFNKIIYEIKKTIKIKIALRKFKKDCPHVRCDCCNKAHYDENDHNDYCKLVKELGL